MNNILLDMSIAIKSTYGHQYALKYHSTEQWASVYEDIEKYTMANSAQYIYSLERSPFKTN